MSRFARVIDLGARDGIQQMPKILSPASKAAYINLVLQSGVKEVEVGSFVSEKVRQMKTTGETIDQISKPTGVNLIALVGNRHYAEVAAQYSKLDTMAVFTSVSESFCQKNNGTSLEKNMDRIREIARIAHQGNKRLRGYVSCVFGCPFEGYPHKFVSKTRDVVQQLLDLGCYEVSIADTIGTAIPSSVILTLGHLAAAGVDISKLAIHLHNPRGKARRTLITALACGIRAIDGCVGGIGGCPSIPDPSANIDTLEVLELLESLKFGHSVTHPEHLHSAARLIKKKLAEE